MQSRINNDRGIEMFSDLIKLDHFYGLTLKRIVNDAKAEIATTDFLEKCDYLGLLPYSSQEDVLRQSDAACAAFNSTHGTQLEPVLYGCTSELHYFFLFTPEVCLTKYVNKVWQRKPSKDTDRDFRKELRQFADAHVKKSLDCFLASGDVRMLKEHARKVEKTVFHPNDFHDFFQQKVESWCSKHRGYFRIGSPQDNVCINLTPSECAQCESIIERETACGHVYQDAYVSRTGDIMLAFTST
jgi:hypothetical protein